jgi:acyl-CoA thioester hydrolase
MSASAWDLPAPHVIEIEVGQNDIDAYQHVNNSVYLSWFDRVAWSHSASLGIPLERCITLRRGMAALRTEVDYVRAALLGDALLVGTWITGTDGKLRVERRFQVRRRTADGKTLSRARTEYVCLNLDSGRATRMPAELSSAYRMLATSQGSACSGSEPEASSP